MSDNQTICHSQMELNTENKLMVLLYCKCTAFDIDKYKEIIYVLICVNPQLLDNGLPKVNSFQTAEQNSPNMHRFNVSLQIYALIITCVTNC